MSLNRLTLSQAQKGLARKSFSSIELTRACLDQIKKLEPKLNAFITLAEDEALAQAGQADRLIGREGGAFADKPLLGIPLSIKDLFVTRGLKTTAGSKVLANYMPVYDATVVARLKDAGAVILGKTNLDAWAHGSSTETSDFGPTKNPWDLTRIPGGSSGGSAAAIAAHETIGSIGSETGGSIRQPAALCGIVGLKPTYGRTSRYGLIAMASSLDCPGPMTKTVKDAALILSVLAGKDPLDATTLSAPVPDYLASLEKGIKGLKIGLPLEYFKAGVTKDVAETVAAAAEKFESLGAKLVSTSLMKPELAVAVYTIIQRAEVSSNLARYDGIRYGNDRTNFGQEAKRRIMLGTYALSSGYFEAYYQRAQKVRTKIVADFKRVFDKVDILLAPTSPDVALPLGASRGHHMFGEISDILVLGSTIAGLPGINIPCGFVRGMPVGMQLVAPQLSEEKILAAASAFETNFPETRADPPLVK